MIYTESKGSDRWYTLVEKAKEKASKLKGEIIAVDQNTSITVGLLKEIDIDVLWNFQYKYLKLTLIKPKKYGKDQNFMFNMDNIEVVFLNKPEMLMSKMELAERFPKVFEAVTKEIRKGNWGN